MNNSVGDPNDLNSQPEVLLRSSIQFRDVAAESGLNFQFDNGSLPNLQLGHLFETTGGGVGILDYDLDGWSDLYLAQGGDWRREPSEQQLSNKAYRNLQGQTAVEVTKQAGLESFEYSQGITIGDYNSDGFADIYVCQLRRNILYENRGDGTFLDVTTESNTPGDEWSLSAAFADLNNDGLSDLHVVNYVDREQVGNTPCEVKGQPRACPPKLFSGTPDKIYLNSGHGEFQEVSRFTGISSHVGKGMGVVVADFNADGNLELFVGNDGEENFLFQRVDSDEGVLPHYEQNALQVGVATDAIGQKQATMGIAAGDLSENGLLDLLVTNFYQESNTYYAQAKTGDFSDQTTSAGRMSRESKEMLSFGVQLLDADLDGDLDVVIANGHVDRSSVTGDPDEMLPQVFENYGEANFQQVQPNKIGDYFQQPKLGRAVAKLDWNRDGQPDLCITHLDQPVALLLNETNYGNRSLSLKLIAVEGERTAIGTVVTVRCGDKQWTQQVTSGDGYLVSNEKQLAFGLGEHETIDEIHIKWNSGRKQRFHNIETNRRYICVEHRNDLIPAD